MEENTNNYDCERCNISFPSLNKLNIHFEIYHENNIFDKYDNQNNSITHNKTHSTIMNKLSKIENESISDYLTFEKEILSDEEQENLPAKKHEDNKNGIITDSLLGIGSLYTTYEEINELNFSRKEIAFFKDNPKILIFNKLTNLIKLDLSENKLIHIDDARILKTLRELNISSNSISDITFLESLVNLTKLSASNNKISTISSLINLKNLDALELDNNNISYNLSTIKTINNLKKLTILTIFNNPFLKEYIGYRHFFIDKFKALNKLDNQEITEIDRDLAEEYVKQNFPKIETTERPKSAKSILNIKKITSSTKEKLFDEDLNIQEKQNQTSYKFFTKNKGDNKIPTIHEENNSSKSSENSKDEKEIKINVDKLKSEYSNMKINFEEFNPKQNQAKNENEAVVKKVKIILPKNSVDKSQQIEVNLLRKEIDILKEQLEEYKQKLLTYEEIMDAQKMQIINLQTIVDTHKDSNISDKTDNTEFNQLKQEFYTMMFENSSLKKENDELKSVLKQKGKYEEYKRNKRPQTAFAAKEEDEENNLKDENNLSLDDEIDELMRKSTANLKNLSNEIKYLNQVNSETTAVQSNFQFPVKIHGGGNKSIERIYPNKMILQKIVEAPVKKIRLNSITKLNPNQPIIN